MSNNVMLFDYYVWLLYKAGIDDQVKDRYSKLLSTLFNVAFIPSKDFDCNRVNDGIDLRSSFDMTSGTNVSSLLASRPCSMLEMMVALACRVEHDIMYDGVEDKTHIWFMKMLESLCLMDQYDENFSESYVSGVLDVFNTCQYRPDGLGGLVFIPNYDGDMRELDIWSQMNIYVNIYDMTEK